MIKPARRFSFLTALLAVAVLATASLSPGASARAQSLYNQPKYAAIVVDAATGEVLYARRADQQRYPASITKIMTLYLVFEALATGRLSLNDRIVLSQHAANQAPSKSGLRAGESISVDEAIRVTALKSANDLAVAFAERIGGSESRFAALMTLRAQELGMTNTRFVNANGLPDPRQMTTARDIAILSRAVMRDYPQYYSYFGQQVYSFRGQQLRNHNHLLAKMPGVDGIKTGFINAAGFNLAASAVRDGRRLITVVLGGSSTAARDENVEDLFNAGFEVLNKRRLGQTVTIASAMREPDEASGPVTRPATEEGSADQAGLKVAVVDNPLLRGQPAAPAAMAQPSGGLKAATLALADEPAASADCAKVTEMVKVRAGRRHHRHGRLVTRVRTVCRAAPGERVQAAANAAPDCDRVVRGHGRRARLAARRASAACRAEQAKLADNDKAPASDKAGPKSRGDAGAYRIQVGAFDSKAAARQHLSKLTRRYGQVVASAATEVDAARRGAYRARFSGFSAQGAKAACAVLSAKGERCMVLAPG